MERVKRMVAEIAYTPLQHFPGLSPFHRSLIPLLSFASSLYGLALSLRHRLFYLGLFRRHRLPVPVISVGNLTWGGNGKTPMVELIACMLADSGISPLILTRGYAGGDEAKMLQRHLVRTSVKIGVGANRSAIAASFFERYGHINDYSSRHLESDSTTNKIGAVILDDGMQHWSLMRDVEIAMINGMMPWGNNQLVPLGPLREPLTSLRRADIVVIHHADLLSDGQLNDVESLVEEIKQSITVFFSRMSPSHFFSLKNCNSELPLATVNNMVTLCVSAIGFANSFIQAVKKMGPLYVDRIDFCDHHFIKEKDIKIIRDRLRKLQDEFGVRPFVVVTEKDYDRNPVILKSLDGFEVLVLCSSLQIMPLRGQTQDFSRQFKYKPQQEVYLLQSAFKRSSPVNLRH